MKPVIRSWPYVATVVALYAGWLVLAKLAMPADELQNLLTLYGAVFGGFVVAGVGAVLGYRRGYDLATVLSCLVTFAVIALIGDLVVLQKAPDWVALGLALGGYTLVGHIGLAAAIGVAKLDAPTKTA
jgi:hypothetical protein